MLLDLIYGGIGSGKTERCIELIERTLKKNPGHNAIITVPDQYSYITEKRIVEHFGGTGLNGVEVLTFSQFFRRYLKEEENTLLPSGKQMLLYRAISDSCDEESIFLHSANKDGFATKMAEVISEMKHYLITPDELENASDSESVLSQKLKATADIYRRYDKLITADFTDSDDNFSRFSEFIKNSDEFKNTHIWFDGFSDFLPQHYKVIEAFLLKAQAVHVSLCLEKGNESDIYSIPASTEKRLKDIAISYGVRIYEQSCDNNCYTINSKEILHLMRNWDNRRNIYKDAVNDISLFYARNLYSETEYIAKMIVKEVSNGVKFGDIGIMCSDTNLYAHLIEAVFGDYNIPYYIDTGISVTEHPIILTVLGVFDILDDNWSYESVFRYLRTGFLYYKENGELFSYDRESIDKLENYVLKHGIRGKAKWLTQDDWLGKGDGVFDEVIGERRSYAEDIEAINKIRKIIIKPFINLYEKISGRRCVKELATALFEFLCDINLFDGINSEIEKLNEGGMRDLAERMKEIWNILISVTDQAVITSGNEMFSREKFAKLIKEGLACSSMKIIPPGLDAISIGASSNNSSIRPKVLFFMGAVNGTMPTEVKNNSLFTDNERKKLEEKGIETAGTSEKKTKTEMFKFFRTVTSASDRLYFSYPTMDSDGDAVQPSSFINRLIKIFPEIKASDDLINLKPTSVNTPKEAFLYIMNAVADKTMKKNAERIKECYKNDEYITSRLPMVNYAIKYRELQPQITAESARLLYNDYHKYSVSRLNDYTACPFSYYVKHGLKAQEQEIWQIQKFDIGSLLHWAVCEYCNSVSENCDSFEETKQKWHNLTDEESDRIIDSIINEISERTLKSVSRDKRKIEYLIGRLKKIIVRSVDIVRLSLIRGEYTACCYEEKFSIDIDWGGKTVGINGTIDRIDISEDISSGTLAIRIIDYKSGKKDFDIVSISNQRDMQLVVYSIAATELYKKGSLGKATKGLNPTVRGILYNKLRDDVVSSKVDDTATVENLRRSNMKLDGLVIVDENDELSAVTKMDNTLKTPGTKSEFMKLSTNSKGGELNKNSKYTTTDKFEILTEFVKKTVVDLDEKIFSGNIDIMPGNGKNKACSYCSFKEICLYDAQYAKSKNEIAGEAAAWEHMKRYIGKGDEESGGENLD